jgi:catechol 2,3-dioxygenase-like lactoylglutathione lyase family enzyme
MSSAFRFDCVFYYVSDLDRAIRFYTDVLGLELVSRDAVARLRVDGVRVELIPTADRALLSGRGNARLTLAVEQVDQATADLAARGVPVSELHEVANGRFASCTDPDGNDIVLWQTRP